MGMNELNEHLMADIIAKETNDPFKGFTKQRRVDERASQVMDNVNSFKFHKVDPFTQQRGVDGKRSGDKQGEKTNITVGAKG